MGKEEKKEERGNSIQALENHIAENSSLKGHAYCLEVTKSHS